MLATIERTVAPARLTAVAKEFAATEAHPDAITLFDFGFVPSDVAAANGYPCLPFNG